jgi:hydrogenase maturation protease
MNDIFVVGIGNPFRADDGAGWAVIDAIEEIAKGSLPLRKLRGDIAELMDVFANHSTVYLIDACASHALPGSWQRIDASLEPFLLDPPSASTHGLSIKEAIALAKNLNQMPSKLIIYAITGDRYQISAGLSAPVSRAIGVVAQNIINEEDIQSCMKKA